MTAGFSHILHRLRGPRSFEEAFARHDGHSLHKWSHSAAVFDLELAPYRRGFPVGGGSRRPLRLLEIGVKQGGSLAIWRSYFGPTAAIWGFDINPECQRLEKDGFSIRIGPQDDGDRLRAVVAEMGGVDIVIDDGSHLSSDQWASFAALFPLLSVGGLYCVEDIQTSYSERRDGGYRREGTFVERLKDLLDDVHRWRHKVPGPLDLKDGGIDRIAVYSCMAFVRKGDRTRPRDIKLGRRWRGR